MERNINSLIGCHLEAKDGRIGEVVEFYFDDKTWKIRYLIVRLGHPLNSRQVLISPDALLRTTGQKELFSVHLTKEQINKSPNIDTDKPVSRQQEIELYGHYGWPAYWIGGLNSGGNLEDTTPIPVTDEKNMDQINANKKPDADLYLCSTARVTGYTIYANDGEIGHVNDFIFDDQTWQLVNFVVDTQSWAGGEKVLIAVEHIKELVWQKFEVFLDMTIAGVKNSPLFDALKYKAIETGNTVKLTGNSL